MNTRSQLSLAFNHVDKNIVAATLSVVPGLGHLYKQKFVHGLALLVVGNATTLWLTEWLAFDYFGMAVYMIPLGYVVAVMCDAYYAERGGGKTLFVQPWKKVDPKLVAEECKILDGYEESEGEGMNGDGV
ncbi:hypothetical protein [Rubritalea marina]|uniref:hypothetical protein n=1 Tax=Rubritalea marina TaxID=361055 RepID=UPI000363B536|nr:hypothetical protein [Rubritalea marina]